MQAGEGVETTPIGERIQRPPPQRYQLTLWQLDESLHDGFRWPLYPSDDITAVTEGIAALLAECRIGDVRFIGRVLPDLSAAGAPWFPRAAEAPAA